MLFTVVVVVVAGGMGFGSSTIVVCDIFFPFIKTGMLFPAGCNLNERFCGVGSYCCTGARGNIFIGDYWAITGSL